MWGQSPNIMGKVRITRQVTKEEIYREREPGRKEVVIVTPALRVS